MAGGWHCGYHGAGTGKWHLRGDLAGWVGEGHRDRMIRGGSGSISSPHPAESRGGPGRAGRWRPRPECRSPAVPRRRRRARRRAEPSGAEDAAGGGRRQPRSRPPSRSRAGGNPAAPRPLSPGPAMGALTSRQNAGVEEVDVPANSVYRYPPKSGEPPGVSRPGAAGGEGRGERVGLRAGVTLRTPKQALTHRGAPQNSGSGAGYPAGVRCGRVRGHPSPGAPLPVRPASQTWLS